MTLEDELVALRHLVNRIYDELSDRLSEAKLLLSNLETEVWRQRDVMQTLVAQHASAGARTTPRRKPKT